MKFFSFLLMMLAMSGSGNAAASTVHSFQMETITGDKKSLAAYKGKALLIVNTASRCGYTPQYKGLEELYLRYKDRGFEILGFPANNFLGQEPGTNEEIKQFCSLKYNVTFPMFSKISVKGKDIAPLYQYLTHESGFNGDIPWNFSKFIVNTGGQVVARFDPKADPLSDELVKKVESILPK